MDFQADVVYDTGRQACIVPDIMIRSLSSKIRHEFKGKLAKHYVPDYAYMVTHSHACCKQDAATSCHDTGHRDNASRGVGA